MSAQAYATIDGLLATIAALRAKLHQAESLIAGLCDELASEIEARYPPKIRDAYPSERRRYQRDMAAVDGARAFITPDEPFNGWGS